MENYSKEVEIRWSDLDPNFHLRHSVYYDWGAYCRISFMNEAGITPAIMMEHHIGPIIFREECIFKKEIKFGDKVLVNAQLDKITGDFSRWTIRHEVWKNGDILAALITVDGAWLDTIKRKLAVPGSIITHAFDSMPRSEGFEISNGK